MKNTSQNGESVVGKRFVRSSGSTLVSFVPHIILITVLISILNLEINVEKSSFKNASFLGASYQILVNLTSLIKANNQRLGNFNQTRHYLNVNKLFLIFLKLLKKTVYRKNRSKSYKINRLKPKVISLIQKNDDYSWLNNKRYTVKTETTKSCEWLKEELLKSGDVESNPGPGTQDGKIITYNIRGLKESGKLKRVLNKCATIIKNNDCSVINLQETHLDRVQEDKIRIMWREGFTLSPGSSRQRGCITLFSKKWQILESKGDKGGRFCITTLSKHQEKFTILI